MLQLSLNNELDLPLVDQIVSAVRTQVEDRVLRPGMRMPPIRVFAEQHQVSRFTVVEAYDRLVAMGYLRSRRGSGFFVAAQAEPSSPDESTPLDRAIDVVWLLRQGFGDHGNQLKASMGWLPREWLDEDGLRRHIRMVSRDADCQLSNYGTPMGYLPLRRQLQIRLAELGIGAKPEQIVLTQGATQALDLAARFLIKAGDAVLVDDPGYFSIFGNLRLHGARLVGVPRTVDGPDTAAMEALILEHRPRVFFTHSVLHNPTSSSLSPAVAHQVLKLAERYDLTIVEDDTYADFQHVATSRLATLDQMERVIYVGSFSKTLSGCLRVGYLAARRDIADTVADIKLLSALPTSEFNERLVHNMLIEGHYRKFMERMHARLEACTAKGLRMLERVGLELYTDPKGGMFAWTRVPGMADTAPLADKAAREEILLAPGKLFRPQMQPSSCLRFNVAYTTDPRLESFLKRALDSGG